jgi:hypothetical protein
LGGIGSCGRELCCSTWLTDFKSVSTTAARYQNLSLNPSKLSGQCGRLKCCLNYELETYMDALKDIPSVNRPLQTQAGDAFLQKTDIFRRIMWFGYRGDNNWFPVTVERVHEVLKMNAAGEKPENLVLEVKQQQQAEVVDFVESLEGSLERLDDQYGKSKKKRNKKKSKGGTTSPEREAHTAPSPEAHKDRPEGTPRPRPERGGTRRPETEESTAPRPERPEGGNPRTPQERGAQRNATRGENRPRPERDPAKAQSPEQAAGRTRPERERDPNRAPRENRPPRPDRPGGPRMPRENRPPQNAELVSSPDGTVATDRTPRPDGEQRARRSRNRNSRNRRPGNGENPSPQPPTEG